MTDAKRLAERVAYARRAQDAADIVLPILEALKDEYLTKMAEVAAKELQPTLRADAVTTLSVALKVLNTVKAGLNEAIRDGQLAHADQLRADKIAQMSDAQQRLIRITG